MKLKMPIIHVVVGTLKHIKVTKLWSLIFMIGKYTLVFDIVDILAKVIDVKKDKLQLGDINIY